eukprot:TRINITY_DN45194_c0_g1_i1.p1 TRINITY_DN45194_c0_g1~~TRINITY_DN45194_c0_g1_i1.p1  ORF type:complete len:221 (+),score=29.90 TRINITY_DN45194_c0_g1_i1:44-706(+)
MSGTTLLGMFGYGAHTDLSPDRSFHEHCAVVTPPGLKQIPNLSPPPGFQFSENSRVAEPDVEGDSGAMMAKVDASKSPGSVVSSGITTLASNGSDFHDIYDGHDMSFDSLLPDLIGSELRVEAPIFIPNSLPGSFAGRPWQEVVSKQLAFEATHCLYAWQDADAFGELGSPRVADSSATAPAYGCYIAAEQGWGAAAHAVLAKETATGGCQRKQNNLLSR